MVDDRAEPVRPSLSGYIEALGRPEHTGANRCWPCTVVNLGLVGLAVVWCLSRDRRLAGVLTAVIGSVAIALRGYVVPYTPVFAPKLVAASPISDDLFGKSPSGAERDSLTATDRDGETVLRDLVAVGAVETNDDVVRPTEAIDTTWHDEMARLADCPLAELATLAETELPHLSSVRPYDDGESAWLVVEGDLVARPVVVAELAAYRAIDSAVEDKATHLAGARAFRMFLDSCPDCGTPLVDSSEVSCCGGYTDPQSTPAETLVCPSCEQRLYTFPATA